MAVTAVSPAVLERLGRIDNGGHPFAAIRDDVHGRHATGGWSQARLARGVDVSLVPADAAEHLIALGAQHSVKVVVVRYEREALGEHGPVAALLRW